MTSEQRTKIYERMEKDMQTCSKAAQCLEKYQQAGILDEKEVKMFQKRGKEATAGAKEVGKTMQKVQGMKGVSAKEKGRLKAIQAQAKKLAKAIERILKALLAHS